MHREDIRSNEFFKEFLEIDKHTPELANNPIKLASRFVHQNYGFKDVAIASYRDLVLFITCEVKSNKQINSEFEGVRGQIENKANP